MWIFYLRMRPFNAQIIHVILSLHQEKLVSRRLFPRTYYIMRL